jgi:CBS domain-containing protein
MSTRELKRLPVVDQQGRLVGWISRVDILRAILHHRPAGESEPELQSAGESIADLMYRDVPTVSADTELEGILLALEQNRRRRAVVIDEEQQVLGIITDGDLLRRTQKEVHPSLLGRLGALLTGQPLPAPLALPDVRETAADLMTAPAATISLDGTLTEALQLMLSRGIKRLPVVDGEGRLVGLLGRATLLRGLLPQG